MLKPVWRQHSLKKLKSRAMASWRVSWLFPDRRVQMQSSIRILFRGVIHIINRGLNQSLEKNYTNFSRVSVKIFFKSTDLLLHTEYSPFFCNPSALIDNECSAVAFGSTKISELESFPKPGWPVSSKSPTEAIVPKLVFLYICHLGANLGLAVHSEHRHWSPGYCVCRRAAFI